MKKETLPMTTLPELALVFLRLGAVAFGGPAAHIAMMEEEFVRRRSWLTHGEFLDLLAATNLIPGPNSTEMAIHIGHRRAGWSGLVVAGVCFILPAFLIVMALAWAYAAFGKMPEAVGLLYGVKPVVIAIIAQALWNLGRSAITGALPVGIAVAVVIAQFAGVNELLLLLLAGIAVCLVRFPGRAMRGMPLALNLPPSLSEAGAVAVVATPFGLWPMFLFFLKTGSVLFGSGYVLIAFLRGDLVERWHWLSEAQLLDAIAIGQITPGPVFTTATFIGYLLGGINGGLLATIGIFLPAFFFVAISGPLIPRLRRSPVTGAFLDGVVAASLGLMAMATLALSRAAIVDGLTLLLAVGSALMLIRYKINSVSLIISGALLGIVLSIPR